MAANCWRNYIQTDRDRGGISRTSAKYDYLDNVVASEEKHTVAGSNNPAVKRTTFTYDMQGRIASESVMVNGNAAAAGTMFDHDLLGRRTYAYWSAEESEMAENLSYDIRGRLVDRETFRLVPYEPSGGGGNGNGGGGDDDDEEEEEPDSIEELVFGQYLKYFNPAKQSSQRRWNGLISEIAHQHGENAPIITNGYFYDKAGRLTDNTRYDGTQQTDKFTEQELTYDRNGNILTLKRYGANIAAPQDSLAYQYAGNKLLQLNNATYTYDANGNTVVDGRRGLTFSWNHLNLPGSISVEEDEDATVDYTYLADGTKAIVQQPASGTGYAYLGTMTYKRSGNSWILESVPFTGGRFIANATGGMDEYRYITDHLGSTRVIVTGTDYHEVEHNDYYPFGKRISDNTLPTTQNNRWRFSGKEIQTLGSIGLVDFGARLYDVFSGKWISQDPLSEIICEQGSYSYCLSSPINNIDAYGLEVKPFSEEELQIIKNTLPEDARQFVVLNDRGYIDSAVLRQYNGNDLNYASLLELVSSDYVITLTLSSSFKYSDPNGVTDTGSLSYSPADGDLMDIGIKSVSGLTTGEGGSYGKTLFPDREGLQNSTTKDIELYLHPDLSRTGAAEAFSHEGYGHALLYLRTGGNHQKASHEIQSSSQGPYDANTVLVDMILTARRKTINNLIK